MHLEPEIWSTKPQNKKCINTHATRDKFLFIFFEKTCNCNSEWSFYYFSLFLLWNLYQKASEMERSTLIFLLFTRFFTSLLKQKRATTAKNISKYKYNFHAQNTSIECYVAKMHFSFFSLPQTRKLVFGVYLNSRTWFNYSLKIRKK